jgi:hypothetical protein
VTRSQLKQAERISYEGRDGDCLLFSTRSWTRGNGIVHHITADFASGLMSCTCEDGRIHHKIIDILTGEGHSCKHLKACQVLCKNILEQWKATDTSR